MSQLYVSLNMYPRFTETVHSRDKTHKRHPSLQVIPPISRFTISVSFYFIKLSSVFAYLSVQLLQNTALKVPRFTP